MNLAFLKTIKALFGFMKGPISIRKWGLILHLYVWRQHGRHLVSVMLSLFRSYQELGFGSVNDDHHYGVTRLSWEHAILWLCHSRGPQTIPVNAPNDPVYRVFGQDCTHSAIQFRYEIVLHKSVIQGWGFAWIHAPYVAITLIPSSEI